jgi:DNA-binding CsgD family transcriptional regulator
MAGQSPFLGPEAIRVANSGPGLNLLVWAGHSRKPAHVSQLDLQIETGRAFEKEHMGFKLNQILNQPCDEEIVRYILNTGAALVLGEQGHPIRPQDFTSAFLGSPFLVLMTRELSSPNAGSRNHDLFFHVPPRIFLVPREQRLLIAAIQGSTDAELAEELDISIAMVKKTWRTVYERVARRMPDLLPENPGSRASGKRGKERKQIVLAYLREHPEELRPVVEQARASS